MMEVAPVFYAVWGILGTAAFAVGYAIPDLEDCRRNAEVPRSREARREEAR